MEDERNTQVHQGGEAAEQVEVKDRGLFDSLLGKKKEDQPEEKKHEEELVTGMEKVSVEEPKKEEHHQAEGEKKESLLSKLHRSSSSSSSSSSDEEEEVIDDNGEVVKRKKKKGLKEKIKEKLPGHKNQGGEHATPPVATGFPAPAPPASVTAAAPAHTPAPVVAHGGHHDTGAVPVEKIGDDHAIKTEAAPLAPHAPEEEKKGLLDKIKEKLPGGHKKPEDATATPPAAPAPAPAPTPAPAPAHPPPVTEEVSSPDGKEKKGILGKIMEKLPGYHKSSGEEDKTAAAATTTAGEHKSSA
uniref:Dehydrin n=1 Tax=Leersia perrieri TaxID=77586 RepID=A0A0D9VJA3_9ORYZ